MALCVDNITCFIISDDVDLFIIPLVVTTASFRLFESNQSDTKLLIG